MSEQCLLLTQNCAFARKTAFAIYSNYKLFYIAISKEQKTRMFFFISLRPLLHFIVSAANSLGDYYVTYKCILPNGSYQESITCL